ncbi:Uncharacterised protein [Mycobacteroides abscessus subsp. massiliense]|nr:Uncharacterised protein [Mycobacteroides abscessus subsp. massiliense]
MRIEGHQAHRAAPAGEVIDDLLHVDLARTRTHRVDDRDRAADQFPVPVRVEPVQRGRRTASTVHRAGADDDQRVRLLQHRRHGRVHESGTAVGKHHAVELFQDLQGA